jgi:uncharacterized protein
MAGGLVALLDDVAALARAAAASADDVAAAAVKASSKAAGVVVDDAAVTPQYVDGLTPDREIPIIRKIAVGSLRNKLLIILPVALILSEFIPWLLQPLLMLGGLYLCFEGAEKVFGLVRGKHPEKQAPAVAQGPEAEKKVVSGAVRTDLILSAEIMVISLNEVADQPLLQRTIILVLVAIGITVLVYGVVGLLVKMDDVGLAMTRSDRAPRRRLGAGLVAAMPRVMDVISLVGTFAMLWVGGHLIVVGLDELGLHAPYGVVHALSEGVAGVPVVGPVLAWLVGTLGSLLVGLVLGALVVAVLHVLPFGPGHGGHADGEDGDVPSAETVGHAAAAVDERSRGDHRPGGAGRSTPANG